MEKIFFVITFGLFITATIAQDSTNKKRTIKPALDDKFCMIITEGKLAVTQNGRTLKKDVVLKNGNKITASGMVIKKDGTFQMIKLGSCVNPDGNEIEMAQEIKQDKTIIN